MPDEATGKVQEPLDPVTRAALGSLGHGHDIVGGTRLSGGVVADTWLVRYCDGTRAVAKTLAGGPADLFRLEAAGLVALGGTGHVRTPAVLAVSDRVLVLEALERPGASASYWAALAAQQAALHRGTVHHRFGWAHDGYLGRLPQRNAWNSDGHAFFAEHRLLRYLGEPLVQAALTAADRRALETLCARLGEIVPPMAPVLTHGDLWSGNLLATRDGTPAVVDPAVCYSWAEVDLAMLWGCPRPEASSRFFEVYQQLNPSPPGWEDRMPILFLREVLSTLAHFADAPASLEHLHKVLRPFRSR